jgi:hypothetical protein
MAIDALYGLVTVDELKDFIAGETGEYPGGVDLEPALEITINAISRWMSEYTGRQLKQATVTEYHDGDGSKKLYLTSPPVAAGSVVIYVDFDHAFGAGTAVTPDLIDGDEVLYTGGWPKGDKNIKAVYSGGYSTIPGDLKWACLAMCQVVDRGQKNGTYGIQQVSSGVGSVNGGLASIAPPLVIDILDRYRRAVC